MSAAAYEGKFSALDPMFQKKSTEQKEGFNDHLEKDCQRLQKQIDEILDARRRRAKEIRQLTEQAEHQQIVISVMRKFALMGKTKVDERVVRDSEAKTLSLREELNALKKKLNLTDQFRKTLEENRHLKQRLLRKTEFCAQFPLGEPCEENTLFEGLMYTKAAVVDTMKTCFEEMDDVFPRGAPSMEGDSEGSQEDFSEEEESLELEWNLMIHDLFQQEQRSFQEEIDEQEESQYQDEMSILNLLVEKAIERSLLEQIDAEKEYVQVFDDDQW